MTASVQDTSESGSVLSMKDIHDLIFKDEAKTPGELSDQEFLFHDFLDRQNDWQKEYDFLILQKKDHLEAKQWVLDTLKNDYGYKDEDLTYEKLVNDKNYQNLDQDPNALYRPGFQMIQNTGTIEMTPGILYDSGRHYDTYQERLKTSTQTIKDINEALKDSLGKACKICIEKQAVPLQICPAACFQ